MSSSGFSVHLNLSNVSKRFVARVNVVADGKGFAVSVSVKDDLSLALEWFLLGTN